MPYGVKLMVRGDFACFTRPEMKVERVSYDVMTPSAARGVLEAVYWKPAIRWIVDRIRVLSPIRFTSIRRTELGHKLGHGTVKKAMRDGESPVQTFIEDDRQQRAALVLRDVADLLEARFEFAGSEDNNPGKHLDMFNRRAASGQCHHRPYLGCREFAADFSPPPEDPPPCPEELRGERDLGWMLLDIDYANGKQPRFFRARMRDGVVEPPAWGSAEARS